MAKPWLEMFVCNGCGSYILMCDVAKFIPPYIARGAKRIKVPCKTCGKVQKWQYVNRRSAWRFRWSWLPWRWFRRVIEEVSG